MVESEFKRRMESMMSMGMSTNAKALLLTVVLLLVCLWMMSRSEQSEQTEGLATATPASLDEARAICAKTRLKVEKGRAYGKEPRWTQVMIVEQCERDGL